MRKTELPTRYSKQKSISNQSKKIFKNSNQSQSLFIFIEYQYIVKLLIISKIFLKFIN